MTNKELLEKTFTQEQRNWLAEHGEPVRGTQTEMLSGLAKQLHDAKVYSNKDERVKLVKTINRTGKVYDLQSFATAAGLSDVKIGDKTLTAADQLYGILTDENADPSKKKEIGVLVNDVYGDGGTEFLKRRLEVEKRNREYAAQNKFNNRSVVDKILDAVISPRQTEAMAEGRVPSDKDKWLDRTENVLMAAPIGFGASTLSKIAKLPGIASKVMRGAGTVAAVAGVPHVMEGLDAAAYSTEENPDRSFYSEGDALLGTVTNLAAPVVGSRALSRLERFLPMQKGAAGISDDATKILDNLADDGVWKKPTLKETDDMAKFIKSEAEWNSKHSTTGVTPEKVDAAAAKADKLKQEAVDTFRGKRSNYVDMYRANEMAINAQQDLEDLFKRAKGTAVDQAIADVASDASVTGAGAYLLAGLKKGTGSTEDAMKLYGQLKNADLMDAARFGTNRKVFDAATEAAQNFVTNKYGSKRDADVVLKGASNMLGAIDPKIDVYKEWFEKPKKEASDKARTELKKIQASKILVNDSALTSEDKDWLGKIIKNPGIVEGMTKEGQSTKFRNWYLLRGQDILRGTELFRPTPTVE